MPELSVDPVYTASLAVTALQQVVARNVSAREMVVVSICSLHAGAVHNVIPDSAVMSGTVRTFSKELRRRMPAMIRRVVAGVCKSSGATFELRYEKGHDVLINDAGATEVARVGAIELFGKKCLHDNPPRLAGEDFSEYLKQAPGCLIRLGTADRKRGTCIAHHSPLYRLDERGLWRGVALLSKLAWERAGSAG